MQIPTLVAARQMWPAGGRGLLGLFDFENFLALVVATLGAGTVRHFALVTIRTLRERVSREMIMGAPEGRAPFGVSPFRICHC